MKHSKLFFVALLSIFLLPHKSYANYWFCDTVAESARTYAIRRDSGEKMREMVKGVMEAAVAVQKSDKKMSKKTLDLLIRSHIDTIESIFDPSQINSSPEIIYNKHFSDCMKNLR